MRDLLLGILLGLWITILLALVERYKMSDSLIWVFVVVTVMLISLLSWRFILDIIHKKNPKLWLIINKATAHKVADKDFWERLAKQEEDEKNRAKSK
jgi:peptidoglycan/LPS O-acetylase OafA/YrhL